MENQFWQQMPLPIVIEQVLLVIYFFINPFVSSHKNEPLVQIHVIYAIPTTPTTPTIYTIHTSNMTMFLIFDRSQLKSELEKEI